MNPKIKICGLISPKEVTYLSQNNIDYAGIVMFFEKSKRNNTQESAKPIIDALKALEKNGQFIRKVAVTVSPSLEQVRMIENLGFDLIQIHGELKAEILEHTTIPILRAYNLESRIRIEEFVKEPRIVGILFDAKVPGSGTVFDWNMIKAFDRKDKLLILAGGLDEKNVRQGIQEVAPDIVDVSSGVEYNEKGKLGKDPEKIRKFVEAVMES